MTYDPFTGRPIPAKEAVAAEKAALPVKAVVLPPNFFQELLAILLQLFGSSVGARDQVPLMSKLKDLHNQAAYGVDEVKAEEPSERAMQRHPMTDAEWEKHQTDQKAKPTEGNKMETRWSSSSSPVRAD